jgi:hypothetical protein
MGTSTSCSALATTFDRIGGPDVPAGDDGEVGAASADRRERLEPAPDLHPRRERGAGDPRSGDLEHDVVADAPSVTDQCTVDVQTHRGEVLAEAAVGELDAEPSLPVVQLLAGEGVHGLVVAAVVATVTDEVADQAAAESSALQARRPEGGGRNWLLRMPVTPTSLAGFGSRSPRLTERT